MRTLVIWCSLVFFGASLASALAKQEPPGVARYRVRFVATWSAQSHPVAFPAGAHFSPLVGAVHPPSTKFWFRGKYASEGIERMAELGATNTLAQEVNEAIQSGDAKSVLFGAGIASSGETTVEFEADLEHRAFTLVSMVAPSPDWFVGVSAVRLFKQGAWIESLTIPLRAWDAGTDVGPSFTAPDDEANPHLKIRRSKSPSFVNAPELGRFEITRIG